MNSCSGNVDTTISSCDFGNVSGNCNLVMNGAGCNSGHYTIGNISGNGDVKIELYPNTNINSITIGHISGNGEVEIDGHENSISTSDNDVKINEYDDISKVEFTKITGNGELKIKNVNVKEIKGIEVSGNGRVCIADPNFNGVVNDIMFYGNGKFGECGGSSGNAWVCFVIIGWMLYCCIKKQKKDNGNPTLPITGTITPSSPDPTPTVVAMPVPPIHVEPEIPVSAVPPPKYQEAEINLQAEPEISLANPTKQPNIQAEPEISLANTTTPINLQTEPEIVYAIPAPQTNNRDFVEELQKLKNMLDTGALTNEEYEIAKAKLLK